MEKVIECPCGVTLRATDDDALVSRAQEHAADVHDMELSRDQALDMSRPA